MTLTNTFLNEMAGAINGEGFTPPTFLAVASDTAVTAIAVTDTSLSGEIGSRESLTGSRTDNVTTLSATRSAAVVVDTANGDELTASGVLTESTGGDLYAAVLHGGITQTTNFDIEFAWEFTVTRR